MDNYLEHYGIKRRSGRYPWGSGEKPYQNDPEKRKLQEEKQKREEDKKRKIEERKRERAIRAKEKILSSPKLVYKYRKKLTQEEINAALRRFEWEKKLKDYSDNDLARGRKLANEFLAYFNTGINLYNTGARVYNTANPDSRIPYVENLDPSKNKKRS